jgi:CRP/FNR family transcriptional regulator
MADVGSPILDHWLLAGAGQDELRPLLTSAQEVRFLPGEMIFEEGDTADGLYLVTAGSVRVTAANERGDVLLATLGSNDVLGEMGVLDGAPRSGTAVALDHCTAYFVPGERFLDTLELSTRLCVRLLALLTERLRLANEPLKRYPRALTAEREAAEAYLSAPSMSRPMQVGAPLIPQLLDSIERRTLERPADGFYTATIDSFTGWLRGQLDHPGPIGDLARYAAEDSTWPYTADDLDTFSEYLDLRGADSSVQSGLGAGWHAWQIDVNRADHRAGSD